MADPWPFPVPPYVWLGLATAAGELPPHGGYQRLQAWLDYDADGVTLANLDSLQWPSATAGWGDVTAAVGFDLQTGGVQLFSAPCPLITISMYDRARIQAGQLQLTHGTITAGYGRFAYGRGGYGRTRGSGYRSVAFGLGGFGRFGYDTIPAVTGTCIVERTFQQVSLCSAGTWMPAGCCEIKRAA